MLVTVKLGILARIWVRLLVSLRVQVMGPVYYFDVFKGQRSVQSRLYVGQILNNR